MANARPINAKSSTLLSRLKLDDEQGSLNCWDSLFELQSCTGEVVLFFLNGETYLGPSCCQAIRTIQNQCWPSMLGSIGIDNEEGDILMGYCDAAAASESGNTTNPQPPSPPQVVVTDDSVNSTIASHVLTTTP